MVTTNPVPVTNEIVVSYPLEKVKQAISLLLECYSPKPVGGINLAHT